MMTRKHFEMTARILRASRADMPVGAFHDLVHEFASEFEASNASFDFDRFATACGIPNED